MDDSTPQSYLEVFFLISQINIYDREAGLASQPVVGSWDSRAQLAPGKAGPLNGNIDWLLDVGYPWGGNMALGEVTLLVRAISGEALSFKLPVANIFSTWAMSASVLREDITSGWCTTMFTTTPFIFMWSPSPLSTFFNQSRYRNEADIQKVFLLTPFWKLSF